ncbi:MAG: hypothetical protein HY343_04815 [Lentisphaerae bacterium]|nr:hypothetical protein [Lentisphaerota bacterium]
MRSYTIKYRHVIAATIIGVALLYYLAAKDGAFRVFGDIESMIFFGLILFPFVLSVSLAGGFLFALVVSLVKGFGLANREYPGKNDKPNQGKETIMVGVMLSGLAATTFFFAIEANYNMLPIYIHSNSLTVSITVLAGGVLLSCGLARYRIRKRL